MKAMNGKTMKAALAKQNGKAATTNLAKPKESLSEGQAEDDEMQRGRTFILGGLIIVSVNVSVNDSKGG